MTNGNCETAFSTYLYGVLCQVQGFQLSAVIETQWEGDEAVGADVKAGQKSNLEDVKMAMLKT